MFPCKNTCGCLESLACVENDVPVAPSVTLGALGTSGAFSPTGSHISDVDECVSPQHLCPRGTLCVNTGGGFQCVSPECPKGSGNVSYVKTSPL